MIPKELRAKWERESDRQEVLFLANHGGGWPDALAVVGLGPEERLDILRGLGFRVAERYEMPNDQDNYDPPWLWARLTNDVAVCLQDGFVSAAHAGGKNGRGRQ